MKDALPRSYFVLSAGVYTAAGLDMQQSESLMPHFRRARPFGAALSAASGAGVLRFCSFVRDGGELAGVENGAVRALAQNLVAATGGFDGGKHGGIRIHAVASDAALIRRAAEFECEEYPESDSLLT